MPFAPGNKANLRGRPKGIKSGRTLALAELDRAWALSRNREHLRSFIQAAIDKDPLENFRTYVMPLLPKEGKVDVSHDGIVKWGSWRWVVNWV